MTNCSGKAFRTRRHIFAIPPARLRLAGAPPPRHTRCKTAAQRINPLCAIRVATRLTCSGDHMARNREKLPWYARIRHGRYILFLALLITLPWPAMAVTLPKEAIAASFDVAVFAFVASVIPLWREGLAEDIRFQAERDDGGQLTLLLLTAVIVLVMLVTVGALLAAKGRLNGMEIALLVGTLLMAWTFSNLVFAFHYARLFYMREAGGKDHGGLDFPGTEEPAFADFVNFSFVLGMTCQTADIAITGQRMRRISTGHGYLAFIFNLGVLALTVNVIAGSL